jgi:putative ABC transport system permease protein
LVERISAVPGVESVGLSDTLPLGYRRAWAVRAAGASYEEGHTPDAFVRIVDRGGMQTLRIPLRTGRYFDDRDTGDSQKVMLVNETMARKMWPGRDPLGQIALVSGNRNSEYTVVGIVADVPHGLEETPQPDMYLNFRQSNDWQTPQLVVRSSRDPGSLVPDIRAALREFDPTLASNEFTTLEQIVDQAIAPRKLITGILGSFSTLALGLAAIGLYGVIAYSVSQRTREIGIRLAVGAQRGDVLNLVIGEGLRLAGIGITLGLAGAFCLTRILQNQLHGVTASDPLTFALIAAILGLVTLIACFLPARRALKIDPLIALRNE